MKIYKFRPLATQKNFNRARKILKTGCFWCSKFSELNDPMEGAFHASTIKKIDEALKQKMRYRICSFSNKKAFEKPIMWGYYANGFRGIAIEVKCDETEVRKVNYVPDIESIDDVTIEEILTTKLSPWKHEKEFRFLKESDDNFHKIGTITAVYFGNPYNRAVNKKSIYNDSDILKTYEDFKENLIKLSRSMGMGRYNVEIDKNNKVKKYPIN